MLWWLVILFPGKTATRSRAKATGPAKCARNFLYRNRIAGTELADAVLKRGWIARGLKFNGFTVGPREYGGCGTGQRMRSDFIGHQPCRFPLGLLTR